MFFFFFFCCFHFKGEENSFKEKILTFLLFWISRSSKKRNTIKPKKRFFAVTVVSESKTLRVKNIFQFSFRLTNLLITSTFYIPLGYFTRTVYSFVVFGNFFFSLATVLRTNRSEKKRFLFNIICIFRVLVSTHFCGKRGDVEWVNSFSDPKIVYLITERENGIGVVVLIYIPSVC